MDRAHFELLGPYHLADLQREAEAARRAAAHQSPVPVLPTLGRLLVRAGTWLQRLDRPCPTCPAPALPY